MAFPLSAQTEAPAAAPAAPAPVGVIKTIGVDGYQRLEPDTVRSYISLKPGQSYTREQLDQALKDLYATELFADVQIRDNLGDLTIVVRENPVINRIVLEGNKRLKEDKIRPEIHLAPRQIFTRSKARADVARIVELYRRQGRFAATVEPKMVNLDQNRVDIVFEIVEGPKSKVRQINILGNTKFKDGKLRAQFATKQSRWFRLFSSGDSYDPDKLAYDQQKLRQFYLTQGYADFRVTSAVAELTPDKKDFILTYVVEEGERYKFGDVTIESDIRDVKPSDLAYLVKQKKGQWYNAKAVEDTVDLLSDTAGQKGYAFVDINPQFNRDKDARTMSVIYKIADAPRVYVESVNINGNTLTKDKVIRREMRLVEGDAFNSFKVKRSRDRIQSLGYFQDKLEVEHKQGSAPDKVVLEANVEEKSTGELQVSAGYSSLEKLILDLSITQHNFMGKGQEVRGSVSWSSYSKSVEVGFTEPYLWDKNIALGIDLFRRDYNSFNLTASDNRRTTYNQVSTGFQVRFGVPLTEFTSLALRYGLTYDQVTLDKLTYYNLATDQCDPLVAGRYLCDAIGNRLTSSIGYSFVFDNLNNRIRPTSGNRLVFSQDFAGAGGTVRYLRSKVDADKYWGLGKGFVFSVHGEAGYIKGLGQDIRLTDRFFLGEPDMRGFDIRGVGPRVKRYFLNTDGTRISDKNQIVDDALGGDKYYHGRIELELPLGSGGRELGLRPSIFIDAGAVWGVKAPALVDRSTFCTTTATGTNCQAKARTDAAGHILYFDNQTAQVTTNATDASGAANTPYTIPAAEEVFFGNSPRPRVAVGFGVNWNSPFGPLRIDIAKALLKVDGDDTKLFSFNVGTQF
jgi:outer membrane protein insertion porin family